MNKNSKIFVKTLATISACVLLILGIVSLAGCNSKLSEDLILESIKSSDKLSQGFINNNYLTPQPYEVFDLSILSEEKVTDSDSRIITCTYTLSNANVRSDVLATLYFMGKGKETHLADVKSAEAVSTPLKGIDFDEQHGLDSCVAEFDPAANTCTVTNTETFDLWFADSTITKSYTYSFSTSGSAGWNFIEEDSQRDVSYKNLEGTFRGKTGNPAEFKDFTIKNFDAEQDTFDIDYIYTATDYGANEDISGTLHATIDTESLLPINYKTEEDGGTYQFEAKGTSSNGDGEASMTGQFRSSDSGEDKIEIKAYIDGMAYSIVGSISIKHSANGPLYRVQD
jgi:hypothetical protein